MKNICFSFLLLVLCSSATQANHILGGFMDYKITGNAAKIRLALYRDCASGAASFDNPASFGIYRQHGSKTVLFKEATVNHGLIVRLKDLTLTHCLPSPSVEPCVEVTEYILDFELPTGDDSSTYVINYQRCCKVHNIANLINPGDQGSTFSVALTPEARKVKNNSPQFNTTVPMIVCAGQQVNIDLSAQDPDNDILLYSLCATDAGGGNMASPPALSSCFGLMPTPACPPPFSQVVYLAPAYTPSSPFPATDISLSPVTGILSFTPNKTGLFTYGLCTEEYRNGLLISNIKRELVLWVVNGTVSAKDMDEPQHLSIMPNPASGKVTLDMTLYEGLQGRITLSDISGRQVLTLDKQLEAQEILDLSVLAPGTFIVSVHTEKGNARGKIIHH